MPEMEQYFHYRNLDVSSVKELAKTLASRNYDYLKKNACFNRWMKIRAISELKYYREYFYYE